MSNRNKAVIASAIVQASIVGIERRLADGKALAATVGLPGVVDRIEAAEEAVAVAHEALNEVAASLLLALGEQGDTVGTFSGGDDKPQPRPGPD